MVPCHFLVFLFNVAPFPHMGCSLTENSLKIREKASDLLLCLTWTGNKVHLPTSLAFSFKHLHSRFSRKMQTSPCVEKFSFKMLLQLSVSTYARKIPRQVKATFWQ